MIPISFQLPNINVWITEIGWNTANPANAACWQDKVVTLQQQADYLTSSFDILFNDITVPGETTPAIDKVFWYRFRDVGIDQALVCPNGITSFRGFVSTGYLPQGFTATQVAMPWDFGIYDVTGQNPKPSQCAFFAYPDPCIAIFLPMVQSGRNVK